MRHTEHLHLGQEGHMPESGPQALQAELEARQACEDSVGLRNRLKNSQSEQDTACIGIQHFIRSRLLLTCL